MEVQDKTQIKAALRKSFGSFIYSVNEMSDEEFYEPLREGKWSPADILGHLILSTKPISKALSMPRLVLQATFGKSNRPERSYQQVLDKYYSRLSEGVIAPADFTYRDVKSKSKDALISNFNDE